jgi:hypothetical protein
VYYDDYKNRLEQFEFRGELRLMTIRHFLLRWGIELRDFRSIWWPAPQYQWIKRVELFTRKWNAMQALVFVQETCNFPDDGMLCEDVVITGRHEFLRGGISTATTRLWI